MTNDSDRPRQTGVEQRARALDGRVIVVGSLNVDTALTVRRHPAPGETTSSSARATSVGGKGANQAIAASLAGARVTMVGAVGSDADAETILAGLRDAGVDADHVHRRAGDSGAAVVIVAEDGENVIVISPGANNLIGLEAIDEALADLGPGDTVVLQNEIPAAATAHAARVARGRGARVVWNAAPAPVALDEIPRDVDIVVVNAGELIAVATLLDLSDASGPHTLHAVARALDADVVCTRGADGVRATVDGLTLDVASPTVRAVDTTAAGDTFVGYFAAFTHLDAPTRLRTAAAAGAVAVTRAGAASSIPEKAAVAALLAH